MKIYTTYVANDGTPFNDEDECLEYETSLQLNDIKDIYCFSDDYCLIPLLKLRQKYDDIYYIYIGENVSKEKIRDFTNLYYDLTGENIGEIQSVGIWGFVNDACIWKNLVEEVATIQQQIDFVKECLGQ